MTKLVLADRQPATLSIPGASEGLPPRSLQRQLQQQQQTLRQPSRPPSRCFPWQVPRRPLRRLFSLLSTPAHHIPGRRQEGFKAELLMKEVERPGAGAGWGGAGRGRQAAAAGRGWESQGPITELQEDRGLHTPLSAPGPAGVPDRGRRQQPGQGLWARGGPGPFRSWQVTGQKARGWGKGASSARKGA